MCVPRLGRITGTSASSCSSSGRSRSAQTPVALTTLAARTANSSPPVDVAHQRARRRSARSPRRGWPAPRRSARPRPARSGRAARRRSGSRRTGSRPRARAPASAGSSSATSAPSITRWRAGLQSSRPSSVRVAPRRRPSGERRIRSTAITSYMFSPMPSEAVRPGAVEGGHDERQRAHQVRRQGGQQLALEQRLADQPEVEVLQVAQPAVDELARARGGAARVVALLDQRDGVAAAGGVQRDAGAGDPAADDEHVERLVGQRGEGVGAREHQGRCVTTASSRRALRRRLGAARLAEVQQAEHRLSVGDPARRAPLRACAAPRECASSRRGRGRARRAGRCSTRTRPRRGPRRRRPGRRSATTEAATSVGARSSLAAASGPAAALEPRERLRAEHAEAPRVGEVVVRRPARELEQLVERRAIDRRGRVGLDRSAGADQLGQVHGAEG